MTWPALFALFVFYIYKQASEEFRAKLASGVTC